MDRKGFSSIDEYINTFPKDVQVILQRIRRTIKKVAPKTEETISYGIPAFKLSRITVVYFAAFKKHIGLYPPAPKEFKKEVARYAGPKGNLKFPLDEPIPLDLIQRIVTQRVKEVMKKNNT